MWKGEHCGQDVAVKVLRAYSNSDLQKIIGVGHRLQPSLRISPLTEPCIEVLQGGYYMENPSAPKRAAPDRSDDD